MKRFLKNTILFSIIALALLTFPFGKATFAQENIKTPDVVLRKQLLKSVMGDSYTEINNLKNRLNKINIADSDWKIIKEKLINDLAYFNDYYKDIESRIDSDPELSLEDIRSIANDLKDWRNSTYTPRLKEITNFILVFEEENLIKIANSRADKITGDLAKFDKQGYIKTNDLKKLFAQARKNLDNSQSSNNNAKELFLKSITLSSATSTNEISATKTDTDKPSKDIQQNVQDLVKESIKYLKSAYETFFQMNSQIKKFL